MVEMALVLPLILMIVIAIAEIGAYFKDYLTISYASREGARIAAFAGSDSDADCHVVTGLANILSEADLLRVERIEIYIASQDGTQGPTNRADYRIGGDPNVCTVPEDPNDGWTWLRNSAADPINRQTVVGSDPLDIVGVRVVMERNWILGIPPFNGSITIDESTITRVEPEAFDTT